MSGFKEVSFADRQKAALEARKNILEKFRAKPGLDDPEVGEVLLASNVGGSSPHGWNRSAIQCVSDVTCFSRLDTAGVRPAGRPGS